LKNEEILIERTRAEKQWHRKLIDIWEERDFFFMELFGLCPYESNPEPEDWNYKFDKIS